MVVWGRKGGLFSVADMQPAQAMLTPGMFTATTAIPITIAILVAVAAVAAVPRLA